MLLIQYYQVDRMFNHTEVNLIYSINSIKLMSDIENHKHLEFFFLKHRNWILSMKNNTINYFSLDL